MYGYIALFLQSCVSVPYYYYIFLQKMSMAIAKWKKQAVSTRMKSEEVARFQKKKKNHRPVLFFS